MKKERCFSDPFYTSSAWIKCRKAYWKSVGGLCERCKEKGLIVPGDEVHHKIRLTPENINNPDITLNWDSLELLCKDCHIREHHEPHKRYDIDDEGHLIFPEGEE